MIFVTITNIKRKLVFGLKILLFLLLIGLILPQFGVLFQSSSHTGKPLEQDPNLGQPLRVEKQQSQLEKDNILDKFVIKLREFYRGE